MRFSIVIWVGLILQSATFSNGASDPLVSLQAIADKELKKIDEDFQVKQEPLKQKYYKALIKILEHAKATGNLEVLTAVKKEETRFLQEKTIPEKPTPELTPLIAEAQTGYNKAMASLQRDTAAKQFSLFSKYLRRLDTLLKGYVKQEKVEQASAVKEEMDKIKGKMRLLNTGVLVSANLNPITRTFNLSDLETLQKDWRLKGRFTGEKDGLKAPRGPANELESLFQLIGDFEVSLSFHFGSAAYSNTGGTWIKVFGEKLGISNGFRGFHAKLKVQRKGSKLIYTNNGKVTEKEIKPEQLNEPTTFYLWWRSRSSHFKELVVTADKFERK